MGNTSTLTVAGRTLEVKQQIGEGAYALVFRVVESTTGSPFVVKRMQVNKDNTTLLACVRNEVKVMSSLPPHRNIVRYIASDSKETPDYVSFDILMEHCAGGSAAGKLKELSESGGRLPEAMLLRWLKDVCTALSHLHSQSPPLAHRDLKAENMLLGADGTVKLCDFGSATTRAGILDTFAEITEEEQIVERTTTLHYRAPELADLHAMPRRRIDTAVDVWALGVLAYRLAFLCTPFEDSAGAALRMGILNGRYRIPAESPYSDGLHSFIRACLVVDPAERPTVFDILRTFWPSSAVPSAVTVTSGVSSRRGLPAPAAAAGGAVSLPASGPESPEEEVEEWPAGNLSVDASASYPARPVPVSGPPAHHDPELAVANAAAFAMLAGDEVTPAVTPSVGVAVGTVGEPRGRVIATGDLSSFIQHGAFVTTPVLEDQPSVDTASSKVLRSAASMMESVQTRVMHLMGPEKDKERWVIKATSLLPGPAKLKYLRFLVVDAWESGSGGPLVTHLGKRPMKSDACVAVKGCVALMKLWHQGPQEALTSSWDGDIADVLTGVTEAWRTQPSPSVSGKVLQPSAATGKGSGFGVPVVISAFSALLNQKMEFHHSFPFVDGQYHKLRGASVTALTPDQAIGSAQSMLRLLSSLLSLTDAAMGVILRVFEYSRAHAAPATVSSTAGLAPGASRQAPHPSLRLAVGGDEVSIIAGALPTLVVEAWGLYRGAVEALQGMPLSDPPVPALRAELDGLQPRLRDLFSRLRNAAVKKSIHPSLDVLANLPDLPDASPFGSPEAAAVIASIARHEGVGFSADFVSRRGQPLTSADTPASPLIALQSGAGGDSESEEEDDDVGDGDVEPYTDDAPADGPPEDVISFLRSVGADEKGVGMNVTEAVKALAAIPANMKCCECLAPRPKWASINLGVIFCVRCSGMHRRLGTHISQCRSLTLDVWQPAWVMRCLLVGNARAASYWEARMPPDARPNSGSTMEDVEAFLRAKYERREWVAQGLSPDEAIAAGVTVSFSAGPHKAKPRRLPSSPAAHTPAPTPPPSAPHTPIPQQQGRPPLPKRALAAPPPSAPSANVNAANSTFNTTAFVAAPKSSLSKSATPSTYSASTTVGSQALIAVDDDPFAGSDGRDPFADFDEPAQDEPKPTNTTEATLADDFDPFTDVTPRPLELPTPVSFGSGGFSAPPQDPVASTIRPPLLTSPRPPMVSPQAGIPIAYSAKLPSPSQQVPVAVTAPTPWLDTAVIEFPMATSGGPSQAAPSPPIRVAVNRADQVIPPPLPSTGGDAPQLYGGMTSPSAAFRESMRSLTGVKPGLGSMDDHRVVLPGESSRGSLTPVKANAVRRERSRSFDGSPVSDDTPDLIALDGPAAYTLDSMAASAASQPPPPSFPGTAMSQPPFPIQTGGPLSGPLVPVPEAGAFGEGLLLVGVGVDGKAVLKMPEQSVSDVKAASGWTAGVEIPWSTLTIGPKVGSGGFAEVFQGSYRGMEVAVKRLLNKPGPAGVKAVDDFKAEVAMMTRLRHPNIVLFIGVVVSPLSMVTEFCSRGNLFDLLHDPALPLSWPLRKRMALDAAKGMSFLHSSDPIIIHRDLKSLNLLIDSAWTLKVSDFGLSRFKAMTPSGLMTAQCGTFHWMAPEVIAGHRYTEKADVYSFAINMWELLTRSIPYAGMQPMQVAMAVLTRGLRPAVPPDCPRDYAALMDSCWQTEPSLRPSFDAIAGKLTAMAEPV